MSGRPFDPTSIAGRVRAMLQAGRSAREIVEALPGVARGVVKTTVTKQRRRLGLAPPARPRGAGLSPAAASYFSAEASARGLPQSDLIARLLETIAADRMIDAVLDESPTTRTP